MAGRRGDSKLHIAAGIETGRAVEIDGLGGCQYELLKSGHARRPCAGHEPVEQFLIQQNAGRHAGTRHGGGVADVDIGCR